MHLLQHFHELSLHPKNAKELKSLILQLAVQGKLTKKWREENPELISGENSAVALLERIKEEKARLVKENKIKKEKTLALISEEEVPYELPKAWVWCRLGEVNILINGDRGKNYPSKAHYISEGIPFITARNLGDRYLNHASLNYISQERFDLLRSGQIQENDILYCLRGSLGKCSIVKGIDQGAIASSLVIVRSSDLVNSLFILNYFSSPLGFEMIGKYDNGTAQPNLSATDVKEYFFPLPPLPEQKAIVSIVEQLFAEVEQLEQLTEKRIKLKKDFAGSALSRLSIPTETTEEWKYLQPHFHSFFNEESNIKKLREAILQLAMQGKLTQKWRQQHPLLKDEALSPPVGGDVAPERDRGGIEPASKLLERIKEEKARLGKEGKIRKEKALPPVTKEDVPYELPEGWAWCRLGESGYTQTGSTPPKSDPQNYGNFIPFLGPGDISDRDMLYPLEGLSEKGLSKGRFIPKDSLMMVCIGGSIGKCNVNEKDVSCNQQINIITPLVNPVDYIKFSCQSPGFQKEVLNRSTGSATPIINKGKWEALPIPFAPLEEQKAIVAKVKSLMALCDELEGQVREAKQQAEDLMQTVVREVFEEAFTNNLKTRNTI